jgi:hypothetical protein
MSKSTVITKSQFAENPPPTTTDSTSFLQRQQRKLKEKQQRSKQDAANNQRSIRTIVQIIEVETGSGEKSMAHQMIPYIDEEGDGEEGVGNGRNDSSVSGGGEVDDANSCDNNNQSLIKNSNLNNGNCNKTNSAQAVRHSSKISNSEQLKKQFMSVDVTEQQQPQTQKLLRLNDDAVLNGLQNGTKSNGKLKMKRVFPYISIDRVGVKILLPPPP